MVVSVQDLITEQRLLVRDTVSQEYFWSDAEMVYALNKTLQQIGVREPIWDDSGDFNITLIAGESRYYYASDVLMVDSIVRASDNRQLEKISYTVKDYNAVDVWRDDNTGPPSQYIENINDRSLLIYPIPAVSYLDTLYLNVYRMPFSAYTTDNMSATYILEPDLSIYRQAVLMGMQVHLYTKADSNTYREDLAAYAEAKFDQLVGPPVSMRQIEARRENSNRRLRYKPHPYVSQTRFNKTYRDRFDTGDF